MPALAPESATDLVNALAELGTTIVGQLRDRHETLMQLAVLDYHCQARLFLASVADHMHHGATSAEVMELCQTASPRIERTALYEAGALSQGMVTALHSVRSLQVIQSMTNTLYGRAYKHAGGD
jgi:hypothetical protein